MLEEPHLGFQLGDADRSLGSLSRTQSSQSLAPDVLGQRLYISCLHDQPSLGLWGSGPQAQPPAPVHLVSGAVGADKSAVLRHPSPPVDMAGLVFSSEGIWVIPAPCDGDPRTRRPGWQHGLSGHHCWTSLSSLGVAWYDEWPVTFLALEANCEALGVQRKRHSSRERRASLAG